ncbi:hypothetical protein LXM61_29990 [Priestia megaterium]|uniref:hypothetical protein n=1 Tax=Priestia megaterium TaxID=1404 RepID=UPI001E60D016|nr:hypothetical protein [Priestia megaterium]MCE4093351.1 hypothetical protein [Priestia megaterium]
MRPPLWGLADLCSISGVFMGVIEYIHVAVSTYRYASHLCKSMKSHSSVHIHYHSIHLRHCSLVHVVVVVPVLVVVLVLVSVAWLAVVSFIAYLSPYSLDLPPLQQCCIV